MGATCPIPDCGYAGVPASVEAHISGSTTGGHAGVLGREMRGEFGAGVPWGRLAVLGVVLVALYLAERGGSDDGDDDQEEYRETVLVDPSEPSLAQEARR